MPDALEKLVCGSSALLMSNMSFFAESINFHMFSLWRGQFYEVVLRSTSQQLLSDLIYSIYSNYLLHLSCINIYIYIHIYYRKRQVKYTMLPKTYQTKLHFFSVSLHSDRPCHNGPPVNQPRCACWHLPCRGNSRSSEPCFGRGTWTGIRVSRHQTFGSKCLKTPMVCG